MIYNRAMHETRNEFAAIAALWTLIVVLTAGAYLSHRLGVERTAADARFDALGAELARARAEIASTTVALTDLQDETALHERAILSIEENLSDTKDESRAIADELSRARAEEAARAAALSAEVARVSGTVGTLDKLARTDPELLQKYSKVYFLNEHYTPERLSEIEKKYLYHEDRAQLFHSELLPELVGMIEAASSSGVVLYVKSAYRSFDEQQSLKNAYTVTYGAGTANQFSADQGYSEHQLGTTVDFITPGLGGAFYGFEKTAAYDWLVANAWRYGFALSYPEKNDFYIYEPWHWRYVGKALAERLHNEGRNFYDLDQREIDAYLVNFFD